MTADHNCRICNGLGTVIDWAETDRLQRVIAGATATALCVCTKDQRDYVLPNNDESRRQVLARLQKIETDRMLRAFAEERFKKGGGSL
jgi:hypothetical protein